MVPGGQVAQRRDGPAPGDLEVVDGDPEPVGDGEGRPPLPLVQGGGEGGGDGAREARLHGAVGAQRHVHEGRGAAVGGDAGEPLEPPRVPLPPVARPRAEPGEGDEGAGGVPGGLEARPRGGVGAEEVEAAVDVPVPPRRRGEVEEGHPRLARLAAEEQEGGPPCQEREGEDDEGEGDDGAPELLLPLEDEVVHGADGEHVDGQPEDEEPEGRRRHEPLPQVADDGLHPRALVVLLVGSGARGRPEEGEEEGGAVLDARGTEPPGVEGEEHHGAEPVVSAHDEGAAVVEGAEDPAPDPLEAGHGHGGPARGPPWGPAAEARQHEVRGGVVVAGDGGGKGGGEGGAPGDAGAGGRRDEEDPPAGGVLEHGVELCRVLHLVGIGIDPEEGVEALVADPRVRRRGDVHGDEGGEGHGPLAVGAEEAVAPPRVGGHRRGRGPVGDVLHPGEPARGGPEEPHDEAGGVRRREGGRLDGRGGAHDVVEGLPLLVVRPVAQEDPAVGLDGDAPLGVEGEEAGEHRQGQPLAGAGGEEDRGLRGEPAPAADDAAPGGEDPEGAGDGLLLAARDLDADGGDAARDVAAVEAEPGGDGDVGPGGGGHREEEQGGGRRGGSRGVERFHRTSSAGGAKGRASKRNRWTRWFSVSATKSQGGSRATS